MAKFLNNISEKKIIVADLSVKRSYYTGISSIGITRPVNSASRLTIESTRHNYVDKNDKILDKASKLGLIDQFSYVQNEQKI
jgi:hypothetical protein